MNNKEFSPESEPDRGRGVGRTWWLLAILSALLPWCCQPPLCWWPLAMIAITPLIHAATHGTISRRRWLVLYLAGLCFWAVTLQGLRHANPLIYPCWIALAAYLGIYPVLFVAAMRRALRVGLPLYAAVPITWVGIECLRNYLLTGLSAAMLGHSLADVPIMIQIADLGGTYAVSLLLASINVAAYCLFRHFRRSDEAPSPSAPSTHSSVGRLLPPVAIAGTLLAATLAYGNYRLNQATRPVETRLALIGLSEPVEYAQNPSRELELFDAYVRESLATIRSTNEPIDAVVWPESMFSGTLPWMMGKGSSELAEQQGMAVEDIAAMIEERRRAFRFRSNQVLEMLSRENGPEGRTPDLIGGCGIVDYGEKTRIYSGIVQVGPGGEVKNWYGKTHLVMFGEYIPLVRHLPVIREMIPGNMGLTTGEGPKPMRVGEISLSPNICIETAVERVTINHLRTLQRAPDVSLPDAIVTVTNDAWFDDSSIVQHHKRCAQLVAVACRRPVLSAANNGPTGWIDSCGRVVEEIPQGGRGHVIVQPRVDDRVSPLLLLGDWPARLCLLTTLGLLIVGRKKSDDNHSDPPAQPQSE